MPRPENPITGDGPAARLARDLRTVRAAAGLTYQQLSQATGVSKSAAAMAASGTAVPTWVTVEAFLFGCRVPASEFETWRQRWQEARRERDELAHAQSNGGPSLLFRLLGPVRVQRQGEDIPIGSRLQRSMLATLLLNANRVVPNTVLERVIWGDAEPRAAADRIYAYMSRLRSVLHHAGASGSLVTVAGQGYRLAVADDQLDTKVFARGVERARNLRAVKRLEDARAALDAALNLWVGNPLEDVRRLVAEREQLTRQWLAAAELRVRIALDLGLLDEAADFAACLVGRDPFREESLRLQMLALYRSGRAAEALQVHERAQQLFADELGWSPGPELRDLKYAIVQRDPALSPSGSRLVTPAVVPAQLPAPALLVGRSAELHRLDAAAAAGAGPAVLSGMAGVGKTALAVHWGQHASSRFPDGQLFANLHGLSGQPVPAGDVLESFLRALLGASPGIPADIEPRAAMFRTLTAGQRILVVLDDAVSAEQIAPLLPGGGGPFTVITSRNHLPELAVRHDAVTILTDPLPPEAAHLLLRTSLGRADTAPADEASIAEMARLCGYLPLALRIVTAILGTRPTLSLPELITQMGEQGGDLNAGGSSIREVFEWSWQAAPAGQTRLLKLLAVSGRSEIDAAAAAALTGVDLYTARSLLHGLARSSLLAEVSLSTYRLHPLMHSFALHKADLQSDPEDSRQAIQRLAEFDRRAALPAVDGPRRGSDDHRQTRYLTGDDEDPAGLAALTAREREIATHVSGGATNAEISRRLELSTHTVNFHLRRIFRKLGIRRRAELADKISATETAQATTATPCSAAVAPAAELRDGAGEDPK